MTGYPGASRLCRRVGRATAVAVMLLLAADRLTSRHTSAQSVPPPSAQSLAQPPSPPGFRTEANYIRVDVYATRNGIPVTDLQRDDFELFDEKAPQRIDQFAHISSGGAAQETRAEPATAQDSAQAAADPNAGLFVLFLDGPHVDRHASEVIRTPLQRALARLVGPNDLLAVTTPEMSARDLTFSRRSTAAERVLETVWGTRDQVKFEDPTEALYASCYPGIPARPGQLAADRGIAHEMILRRREKRTLDALEDLVVQLRDLREERKAIITVTNGWRLFGRNASLSRTLDGTVPAGPTISIDPANGRLTTADQSQNGSRTASCERDRLELADLDHQRRFRQILDLANRANASFYPIDPRGMAVFDEDIMPAAGVGVGPGANPTPGPVEDQQRLTDRRTSLQTMAQLTDGLAVVNMNDLAAGLSRITADLSSYYLLGYYSNRNMDGKFHPIAVRVKRPGIQIRARPGYLAAPNSAQVTGSAATSRVPAGTPSTVASPAAAASVGGTAVAAARAVDEAIGSMTAAARDIPFRLRAVAGWAAEDVAAVWLTAEVGRAAIAEGWSGGGEVDAMLLDASGTVVGTARAHLVAGSTNARLRIPSPGLVPGAFEVRVRAKGAAAAAALNESVRVSLPAAPLSDGVMFSRLGAAASAIAVPTADVRFRRNERLRVAIPAPVTGIVTARLLDRAGAPMMAIPLAVVRLDDPEGFAWQTTTLTLAPLAPGDYVIELTVTAGADSRTTLAAFRVIG